MFFLSFCPAVRHHPGRVLVKQPLAYTSMLKQEDGHVYPKSMSRIHHARSAPNQDEVEENGWKFKYEGPLAGRLFDFMKTKSEFFLTVCGSL